MTGPRLDVDPLSPREVAVLRGLAAGATAAEIGAALFLSEASVKTYGARLRTKLGARNAAHAVDVAWRTGLLPGGAT